jgi:hypothetical protein
MEAPAPAVPRQGRHWGLHVLLVDTRMLDQTGSAFEQHRVYMRTLVMEVRSRCKVEQIDLMVPSTLPWQRS